MTGGRGGLDWPALLRVGVRDLGLAPAAFWALTPAELWLMLGPDTAERPMGRRRLDELRAAYPDTDRSDRSGIEGDGDG